MLQLKEIGARGKMLQIVNTTANMKCFKLDPENGFAQGH